MSSQEFSKQMVQEAFQEAKQGNLAGAYVLLLMASTLDPKNETLNQAAVAMEKKLPAQWAEIQPASSAWVPVLVKILQAQERMESRLEQLARDARPLALAQAGHAESVQAEAVQVTGQTPEKAGTKAPEPSLGNGSLTSWLAARNVRVSDHNKKLFENEAFTRLAVMLGQDYAILEKLYNQIKRNLSSNSTFTFSLNGASQDEIAKCTQFCHLLHNEYAMLSEYWYDRTARRITARAQHAGEIINFFTGGWLEIYVAHVVKTRLTGAGVKFEALYNAKITLANNDDYELDLLYLIDNRPLWIECKTGEYQRHINRFHQNVKMLNIPLESSFLLIVDLNESTAANLHAIHRINFVNIDSFEAALSDFLKDIPGYVEPRIVQAARPVQTIPPAQTAQTTKGPQPIQTAQVKPPDFSTHLNKCGVRPLPEIRPRLLAELVKLFEQKEQSLTMQEVGQVLPERMGISKSKIADLMKVLKYATVFLCEDGQPAGSFLQTVHSLSTMDVNELEELCLLVYARELIKSGRKLDSIEHRQMFLDVTGGPVPNLAKLEGRDWRIMDGEWQAPGAPDAAGEAETAAAES